MVHPADQAEQTIRAFMRRVKKKDDGVELDTPLYADGIGLDSLETAELSAILEDELGTDPFSADTMPQTVGDIVAFYRDDVSSQV
jgi:acyl carrier protein